MKLGVVSQNGRTQPLFYYHTDLSMLTGWSIGMLVGQFIHQHTIQLAMYLALFSHYEWFIFTQNSVAAKSSTAYASTKFSTYATINSD